MFALASDRKMAVPQLNGASLSDAPIAPDLAARSSNGTLSCQLADGNLQRHGKARCFDAGEMHQSTGAAASRDLEYQPITSTADELKDPLVEDDDEHVHYSQRASWLRAFVLGANDGLVSVAALMLGVGGGDTSLKAMRLAGIAGWIACALSMAVGEYVSVASQHDCEIADIEKERVEQAKGPAARAHELDELTQIYISRGVSPGLARQVAEELTEKDVIRAHARDELGIDMDNLANPVQAALVSMLACTIGAAFPLLAGAFITDYQRRLIVVCCVSAFAMALSGWVGAALGGARVLAGTLRCLLGGVVAMGLTYGLGVGFGSLAL